MTIDPPLARVEPEGDGHGAYQQHQNETGRCLLHQSCLLAAVQARIERLAKDQGDSLYNFVICLLADERPIGEVMLADVDRRNGSAEVGIFIGEPEEWGKGYGTEALRALVDFGFGELRLERIWLEVWTENARARRAYEKAGFALEGTIRNDRYEFGVLTSGDIMSVLRDEWLAPPHPGG